MTIRDENIRLLHVLLSTHAAISDNETPPFDSVALDEIGFLFLHTTLWNFLKVQVKEKEQLKADNKELLKKNMKLGRDLAVGSQASEQLQRLTEQLHKEQEDHQLKIKQLTTEYQQVQERMKATQESIGEMQRKSQEVEQAKSKLQQQLQESQAKLDSTTKVCRKYDKERRLLQCEVDDITHQRDMLQWDLKQCTKDRNAAEQGLSISVPY